MIKLIKEAKRLQQLAGINEINVNKPTMFYRLEVKSQLEQDKIIKLNVEAASNLNELAIIIYSWYGLGEDFEGFQLFELKGRIQNILTHKYQLDKTKQIIDFCDKNNIFWEFDENEDEFIYAVFDVPTIEIIEQRPINNSILGNIYKNLL
jgi:hypothetical protein